MKIFLLLIWFQIVIFPQSDKIFPDDAKPIELFGNGFFTEGPAQAPDGSVYFSDLTFTDESGMIAGIIWKYIPSRDTAVIYRSPSGMSNGITFDKNGNMIVCEGADYGGRKITSTDIKTGKSKIVSGLFNGKPYNSPNDIIIDNKGRIYFTDPRYSGYESVDQPVMGVYRIDTNGSVKLIIDDILMPNGITISPDEKILYVGCNFEGNDKIKPKACIYKYDINEKGEPGTGDIFINFTDDTGVDGITVDKNGNLYAAVRNEKSPSINVYNKMGKEIDSVILPEVPSNVKFGRGDDSEVLFITAGGSLYKIKTNTKGLN